MTYARLGHAYATLKRMYFNVCTICLPTNADMYYVLSCLRCAKASRKNSFLNDLKSHIDLATYSMSYINFLITVASLCDKYPQFLKTPWDTGELNKYIYDYLPVKLEAERPFWAVPL